MFIVAAFIHPSRERKRPCSVPEVGVQSRQRWVCEAAGRGCAKPPEVGAQSCQMWVCKVAGMGVQSHQCGCAKLTNVGV